jgi:hypothetical protein
MAMQTETSPRALTDDSRHAADDVFPPLTSRSSEIEAIVEFLRGVFSSRMAVYVSAPITSGRRFFEWYSTRNKRPALPKEYESDHLAQVVAPNRSAAIALVKHVREIRGNSVIDPTSVHHIEGWTQGDFRTAWARVIEEFAKTVVFANGWEFSNGCSYEFLVAVKSGIETVDEELRPLSATAGLSMIRRAATELLTRGLPSEFLRGIVDELSSLADVSGSIIKEEWPPEDKVFKDAVLDSLASHGNVAQFVSFSPTLELRYSRIVGHTPNAQFASLNEAIETLLEVSIERSVNVRSYHPEHPKSREFVYGIRHVEGVEATVRRLADQGLYTIVNETVDVNDGGVSGVALSDVIEFAPGDTPRCVEKPGTVSLPRTVALSMLQRVYGFAPTLPAGSWRVEFSIHPIARGHRQGHTILWEAEREESSQRAPAIRWPNDFSRFLGDKAFGLLLADCLGFAVPSTTVISRRIAPFVFGRSTGTGETWLRTSPREPVPGKFTTMRGWTDPFVLLQREDSEERVLASVLSQESVRAVASGAAIGSADRPPVVEGVNGFGTEFMLGEKPAEELPSEVKSAVNVAVQNVIRLVGGTAKVEWAFDEEVVWILQLQQLEYAAHDSVIVHGERAHFRPFEVALGIERFREFVSDAKQSGDGVLLVGNVGITSHFGDILRRSGIPSRLQSHRDRR